MSTLSDAAQIRIAPTPPVACAACFGQYPDRRHIDFGASYDGPVLDGAKAMQIDDLIICEDCVAAAAARLGFTRETDKDALLESQAERLEEMTARLRGQDDYIAKLEAAVQTKRDIKRK